jgi:antitoxin MazE
MRVYKWGKGLAVRLPSTVVEDLKLKADDEVEIHVAGARELGIARKPGRKQLLK